MVKQDGLFAFLPETWWFSEGIPPISKLVAKTCKNPPTLEVHHLPHYFFSTPISEAKHGAAVFTYKTGSNDLAFISCSPDWDVIPNFSDFVFRVLMLCMRIPSEPGLFWGGHQSTDRDSYTDYQDSHDGMHTNA